MSADMSKAIRDHLVSCLTDGYSMADLKAAVS